MSLGKGGGVTNVSICFLPCGVSYCNLEHCSVIFYLSCSLYLFLLLLYFNEFSIWCVVCEPTNHFIFQILKSIPYVCVLFQRLSLLWWCFFRQLIRSGYSPSESLPWHTRMSTLRTSAYGTLQWRPIMCHGGPRVCRFSLRPITTPADFTNDHIRCNDRSEWKPAYTRPSMAKIGHPWYIAITLM